MDEISAVLGISQLRELEFNLARRNEIARKYNKELKKIEQVKLFKVPSNFRHSYYKYPVLLSKAINKRRLIEVMKGKFGVAVGSIYDPPCHLQPLYQYRFGFKRGMFPVAEEILEKTCCLPIYPQMTEEEIHCVLQSFIASLSIAKESNCHQ
jgi:dTDP-4-amino-4,6-dideoxygalactose transaminase